MATTTPRIGLTKPDGTDLVDIAVLNTNFDKIDSNIASTKIQSTKPTTANAGDLWWDSDTGTLYLYYTDANSSQWVAATSDPVNIGVVANQTERDAQYPTPAQGMSVYRTDLGVTQRYYGLFNSSTNPGGRDTAGWYNTEKSVGLVPVVPTSVTAVSGSASINSVGVISFTNCTSLEMYNIFSSAYRNYKVVLTVKRNGTASDSYLWSRFGNSGGFTSASYRGGVNSVEAGFTTVTNVGGGDGFYIGRWYYDGIFISGTAEIMAPNITGEVTHYTGQFQGYNASSLLTSWSSGDQNTSTAWTNLNLNTSAPSMSGTIQILGYNDK